MEKFKMPYIKSKSIPKRVYHYTKKENYNSIMHDGKIIASDGLECWFCLSIPDLVSYLELTALNEGKYYITSDSTVKTYPKFIPDDYIVLELKPRYSKDFWYYYKDDVLQEDFYKRTIQLNFAKLKIGFRGDLEFKSNPKVYEMTEILKK